MSLLHAEYLKLTRRKFYPVMLVILLLLVAFSAFFLLLFGQIFPELGDEIPVLEKPEAFGIGAQQVAAQTWFPLILAVVLLGSELGSTVWATSLTRNPSKFRHVLSRLLVFALASWLAYALGTALWAVFAHFGAGGFGAPDFEQWVAIGWRLGVAAVVWSALGLAAVAVLRSVGPAIGAVLAFYFVDQMLGLWQTYERVSLTAATNGLFGQILEGWYGAFVPGASLSVGRALTIIGAWTLFAFVLTWWGLARRDA